MLRRSKPRREAVEESPSPTQFAGAKHRKPQGTDTTAAAVQPQPPVARNLTSHFDATTQLCTIFGSSLVDLGEERAMKFVSSCVSLYRRYGLEEHAFRASVAPQQLRHLRERVE